MMATLLLFTETMQAGPELPAPVLRLASGSVSKDGHIKLTWRSRGEVEVQQATSKRFETVNTIYQGRDGAIFISGLENGTYYYRIRAAGGAWSVPVMVTVKHHSLRLAIILFTMGAFVFGLTLFIVVKGARNASVD